VIPPAKRGGPDEEIKRLKQKAGDLVLDRDLFKEVTKLRPTEPGRTGHEGHAPRHLTPPGRGTRQPLIGPPIDDRQEGAEVRRRTLATVESGGDVEVDLVAGQDPSEVAFRCM